MLIFMFATAMMLAMLIATVFALHQEAQRARVQIRKNQPNKFIFR